MQEIIKKINCLEKFNINNKYYTINYEKYIILFIIINYTGKVNKPEAESFVKMAEVIIKV